MSYQPTRTRIAERAGTIRAQTAPMPCWITRAGEPKILAEDEGEGALVRYGVALAIRRGARFTAAWVAWLSSDGTEVFIGRPKRKRVIVDLPPHARSQPVAEAA